MVGIPCVGSRWLERVRGVPTAVGTLQRAVFPEKPVNQYTFTPTGTFVDSSAISAIVIPRFSTERRTPESSSAPLPHSQIRKPRLRKEAGRPWPT